MTEIKQENKKRGKIRWLFKWIGLGVLGFLTILAFVFQAPWKVITLLAIVLLACTILPRRYRKWFWLSVCAAVLILLIWVFLPEDDTGWRPYTFDEELAALEAKYAIPDEENAATIYDTLLRDYDPNIYYPDFLDPNLNSLAISELWLSRDYPELASWLKDRRNTIAELIKAAQKEKCYFQIAADFWSFDEHIKRFAPMRRLAFLLMYAVNNDIAEGRLDQAIEKNLTLLQMAKHMRQQPTNIDIMVGFAFEELGLGGINNFLVWSDANESHLGKIEKAISAIRYDLNSDLPNFITLEKLRLKNMYGVLFYEINSKGKARLSRDPWAVIRESLEEEFERGEIQNPEDEAAMQKLLNPPGFWKKRYRKLRIILMWFFIPETPEKMDRIVNESYEKLYTMAKTDFDWSKETQEVSLESLFQFRLNFRRATELMAQSEESHYFQLHDIYIRQSAKHRGTLLIIALRRYKNNYGKWPENLEAIKSQVSAEMLVDPLNEGSFVYKVTEDGFMLYSKGENNIDEGGRNTDGPDDWSIWPLRER